MQAADRQNPSNPPAVSWGRFGLLAAAAVVFLILDQATKAWIQAAFFEGEFIRVLPFFNLCHVRNTGAAFSFLSDAGGWQTAFFVTMASVVTVIALITMKRTANRFFQWASVLIVSGAVGNAIDRVVLGSVVDFLDFHLAGWHWPAFNVADIAICLGAFLIVVAEFKSAKKSTTPD
ncbi:MAG: lipoprotein signal peptidase [Duodenibacillus sp.]|nr:lipoprotein signal peptidase [Duodenibacillus sp.]